MDLQQIKNPDKTLTSKFNYIIDVNHFLICKLTQDWSHLFFTPNKSVNLCKSLEFDDLFIELKRTFAMEDVYDRKQSILNKNGLDGTLLDMKVQLLQQLFNNFQENSNKDSLHELIQKDILLLKSLANVFPVFDVIIELMEYLDSLMIKKIVTSTAS